MFTLKLEPELRDQFVAEAAAVDRPASQLVREFMRDFVQRQRAAREHDAWFRTEGAKAMCDVDDPTVARIPNDEIESDWRRQRADLLKRAERSE